MKRTFSLSLLLSAFCLSTAAHAVDITGAGSSFVYPVLSKWSQTFSEKTGNRVNYQSIGSGGGIAQIKAATVDFGATDAPMSTEDLQKGGLGQFPTIIGGIVPVVNVDGVEPGKLKLDGPLLAKIFMGEVKTWNDPAIAALNPGMKLPDTAITVVRRSDGSGTSYNFTNYLSKVSPEWKEKFNFGTTVNWPVGVGGKGNEGIAAYVKQIKGSIGYVEYAYALTNKMAHVELKNAAGKFVEPDSKSFQAAAATADWKNAKDFNLLMTNAPGADAWPITATTWIVMYKDPKNEERSKVAFEFFKWALDHGQKEAEALDYVPVPETLVKQIEGYWASDFKK
ncbi:phosphate ABC transporter substrate-binding protein [Pseudomonas oryzihabitans]|nr:phosphate ABC transporter substrate-binding protein [Pseudomonas psychrotolerans]KTT04188.1 phosphate ABC transporter substrate-binding protein [Pseudomonas psychrotolerans]KTT08948.1 phosphate ABC transporter substrate-binding protein [Pseudomonas psychrotolerans]KTT21157.1 phosphate ABC transporter substrate-binding protein [Pseudomonas psychrotolerans]KTT30192.1 phosphate ABC transporter substrate-binding protein [Pseudomonas psychrotolerans]